MSVCSSCSAPIIWVTMNTGRKAPLDAKPSKTGNVIVAGGVGCVVGPDTSPLAKRHTSHFATCPNAAQHRKERTRG